MVAVTSTWSILNILIRSGDIRRRSLKSTEIGPNFACFWPLNFFKGGGAAPPKFWIRIIKLNSSEHRAKFRGDRSTELDQRSREE